MKKIKILYITSLSGSRLNNFMFSSLKASLNLDIEFHLACNFDKALDEYFAIDQINYPFIKHNVSFKRFPLHFKNIAAYLQLRKIAKNTDFDIVHCNTPVGGFLGRLVYKNYKDTKLIYTAHGFHFYKNSKPYTWLLYYPVELYLSKYTDLLITINEEDYKLSKKMYAFRNMKINGVGVNTLPESSIDSNKELLREKYNIDADTIFISVGELNRNKNHRIIFKALNKLEPLNLNYKWLLCGVGKKQSYYNKLVKKFNLEEKVIFMGFRKDIPQLLFLSDVFIFPSKREGLSLALMEAMSAGLPCIVSGIRGNIDLIENNKNGYICNNKDYTTYYDAILKIIANRNQWKAMAMYSKKKILDYSVEQAITTFEEIYNNLL